MTEERDASWPARMHIGQHQVHLWSSDLSEYDAVVPLSYLADEERARHQRFYFEPDKRQFALSHTMLRSVLSLYTGIPADQIEYCKTGNGKPGLVDCGEAGDLRFNLSHSGNRCLLGIVRDYEIGVDVEYRKPVRRFDGLVRRCFDPVERASLAQLDVQAQQRRFYDYWTLKEAVIKACGRGLTMPLQKFGFRFAGKDESSLSVTFDPSLDEAAASWLCLLSGDDQYSCSIALMAQDIPVIESWKSFSCVPLSRYSARDYIPDAIG